MKISQVRVHRWRFVRERRRKGPPRIKNGHKQRYRAWNAFFPDKRPTTPYVWKARKIENRIDTLELISKLEKHAQQKYFKSHFLFLVRNEVRELNSLWYSVDMPCIIINLILLGQKWRKSGKSRWFLLRNNDNCTLLYATFCALRPESSGPALWGERTPVNLLGWSPRRKTQRSFSYQNCTLCGNDLELFRSTFIGERSELKILRLRF